MWFLQVETGRREQLQRWVFAPFPTKEAALAALADKLTEWGEPPEVRISLWWRHPEAAGKCT